MTRIPPWSCLEVCSQPLKPFPFIVFDKHNSLVTGVRICLERKNKREKEDSTKISWARHNQNDQEIVYSLGETKGT